MQPPLRKILHSEVGTGIRPAETAGRCIATTGCGPARGTGVVLRGTSVVLCGAGAVLRGAGAAPVWNGCDLAWNGCGPACGGAGMAVRQVRSCGAARCGPAVRLGVALRRGEVRSCGAAGAVLRRGWCGGCGAARCGGCGAARCGGCGAVVRSCGRSASHVVGHGVGKLHRKLDKAAHDALFAPGGLVDELVHAPLLDRVDVASARLDQAADDLP